MALTRDFHETIKSQIPREPEFAQALLNEAVSLFLNGEPETARLILRAFSYETEIYSRYGLDI